jgi:hypothetical protein
LLEELAPAADRVVVKEQRMGDLLTAPPFVQKHQGIRTRVTRQGEDPSRASAVSAMRSSSLRKPD